MTSNVFSYNAAINGGALYCDSCTWSTMVTNTFNNNIARNGGALYISNPSADITFDSHTCTNNEAGNEGGVIYLT